MNRCVVGFALLFLLAGHSARAQDLELVPCGRDDWRIRADAFLGPQYFTQAQDLIQFGFGVEGRVRLWGPLALGVSSGLGLIETTGFSAQASLRLHLARFCNMELALDARAGLWFDVEEASDLRLLASGAMELMHDLAGRYFIGLRAGGGYLAHDDFGGFIDLAIVLGVNWFP